MAALGRILQIAGWLWVVAGFITPAFGLPNISFFPGIILVFVARVLRNQAERSEMPELGEGDGVEERPMPSTPEPATGSGRPMNTDRQRQAPRSSPQPAVLDEQDEMEEHEPRRRNELLEQIVSAGRETSTDEMRPPTEPDEEIDLDTGTRKPMSSAEMLARAHERWDSKKR